MKTSTIIVFVAICVSSNVMGLLSEEKLEKMRGYAKECAVDFPTTIEDLHHEDFQNGGLTELNKQTKCFINCFFEKAQIISGGVVNSEILEQKLGNVFEMEKIRPIMKKCNVLTSEAECETAIQVFNCYFSYKDEFIKAKL